MLGANICEEAPTLDARYASAVTMLAKRTPDGSWPDKRFCVDLRRINANSVADRYKVPQPEDLFRRMPAGGPRLIAVAASSLPAVGGVEAVHRLLVG
jgi:hypothetical protein